MKIFSQKTSHASRIANGHSFRRSIILAMGFVFAGLLPVAISDAADPLIGPLIGPGNKPSLDKPLASEFSAEFIGRVEFSGDAVDQSGLTGGLEDQSPANRLGGFSAIEYSGKSDRFVVLADRGAGDGSVSYPCRMQQVDLRVEPEGHTVHAAWVATVMLTATDGTQLEGSSTTAIADRSQAPDKPWHAMDPEGIRRWGNGWLISDEYGPHIGCFDLAGHLNTQWQLPPSRGCCKTSKAQILDNDNPGNHGYGCFDNKGLEGLAVTPSGATVWASYQSSLLQDGELVDGKCRGAFTRWLAFDHDGNRTAEVAYPMDSRKSGISEILAVDEHRMLVLERDGKAGNEAAIKRIYLADILGASDVSQVEALPRNRQANRERSDPIKPVQKRLLIDLMDLPEELGDAATAEKPEGLTWGPPLEDGRRTLWICWDNDFDPKRKSYIACFAID